MAGSELDVKRWEMTPEKARQMAHAARYGLYSYIPPLLAEQIVNDYHITWGKCLDVGAGSGRLGIEIARISQLEVTAFDISFSMLKLAQEEINLNRLKDQVVIVQGRAEAMPFAAGCFDLIVSKGSIWFFADKVRAFREIYRVLKPGGIAYVGCGDARRWPSNPSDFIRMVRFRIKMQERKFQKEWQRLRLPPQEWEIILKRAGVNDYRFHAGYFWIEIRK
ncbi:MAG: class I SAM-dependent methyltransferase [Dehalococcoidales bacterium]|nr:class I SAM-dependent methyltransferase [Dehalococcoidales bacterium]